MKQSVIQGKSRLLHPRIPLGDIRATTLIQRFLKSYNDSGTGRSDQAPESVESEEN
jgi:hypothetical protein